MTGASTSDLALYRRCVAEARPFWRHVSAYLLLGLLATPLALLAPLPLKIAVDSVLGSEPLPGAVAALLPAGVGRSGVLAFATAAMVAVAILSQLQRMGASVLYTRTAEGLVLRFRSRLFQHVQRLSMLFHERTRSAEAAYRVLWDGAAVRHVVLDGITPHLTSGITLAAMVYVIFRLDAQLAVVAMVVTPVLFLIACAFQRQLRGRWLDVYRLESRGLAIVHEVLSAIRVVQAFGQEAREHRRFQEHSSAGADARVRATIASDVHGALISTTLALGSAVVLLVGVRHVQEGSLTLGGLLVVMAYLGQLYAPLETISKNVGGMQAHLASAQRAFLLLDETPDVVERPNARRLGRARGEIALDGVDFDYGDGRAALEAVSIVLPAERRIGIVGATGAGKSTLVGLLMRFYDPVRGTVRLDGVDVRDLRIADLRRQFSIVPQEALLFSAPIAENIAFARPGASREEIETAARAANAHEFILGLPAGYDTVVGDGGAGLSGGERQRVALARAFLKDAPVLILDEPTSAVDLATEEAILEALERLVVGRTTLVIAHRPSTLVRCDFVIRLERGRVVAQYRHADEAFAAVESPLRSGG